MRYVKPSRTLPDAWGAPLSGTRDMEASIHSHETVHQFVRDLAWIERTATVVVYIATLERVQRGPYIVRKHVLLLCRRVPTRFNVGSLHGVGCVVVVAHLQPIIV
jgi:hypothetical protein